MAFTSGSIDLASDSNPNENGGSDDKLMRDAKTNIALDLLQNPMYTIDLSLSWKLSKEITLTSDVWLCDIV